MGKDIGGGDDLQLRPRPQVIGGKSDDASIIAQCRPRIVIRAAGPPLIVYTLDNTTRISRLTVVPDEIWDGPDWASYQPPDEEQRAQAPDEAQGDQPPQWLNNPSSRQVAALMNERALAAAEADAITTAIDDVRVMLAEGDFDGADHLLDLMSETANAIVRAMSKPPPNDI